MAAITINIVAFDIPFPANYGGTIDIFYKLKTLKSLGAEIILHCFKYNKDEQAELEKYCKEVHYYPRKKGFLNFLSNLPYIVLTRGNSELLTNLKTNDYPILFEGLHTCAFLDSPELKNRIKMVRTHNVEHDYYQGLADASNDIAKKTYYKTESKKLEQFEHVLNSASAILSISPNDHTYFSEKYKNVHYMPAFHPFETVTSKTGSGNYFLYHGNLSVEENQLAVDFLIDEVFSKVPHKLIVAGRNPEHKLKSKTDKIQNIKLVSNPSDAKMKDLLANAQACVLPTFQATGLKLKLLISLFSSRFVIANDTMINNTGLDNLCERADSAKKFIEQINKISTSEFTSEKVLERAEKLKKFSNHENGKRLLKIVSEL